MTLYLLITAVMAVSGVALAALTWMARTPAGAERLIRHDKDHNLSPGRFWRAAIANATVSLVVVYGVAWALAPRLFHDRPVGPLRSLVEGLAILALFDFFYYLVHRYPFHQWRLLRAVHAVHHRVRNPVAVDSLYQHPLEDFIGLALLWACVAAVALLGGPVSVYTFGWVFLIYSLLNVVVHAGLEFRSSLLRPITHLAVRHNKHHVSMNGKNYASVTPLWDRVFGTEEP